MEQPESNAKLTFDQLQAIDVTQKRLANLESEVNIATKSLKVAKLDADRATKENLYQNELLGIVTAQVAEKQKKSTELDEQILEKSNELRTISQKVAEFTSKQTIKEMELKDREDKVSAKELQLSNQGNALGKERIILENDKAEHAQKFNKLKEVIQTF